MATDFEKMYSNLNELLEDICKFFSNENMGALSSKDKKLADALIARCKVQLQEISKIQHPTTNEEYVDMDKNKDDNNADTETTSIIEEEIICPYNNLPAKQASQEIKYGTISMRRKFLLGFEKMRRAYASIHNQWLLIYSSERDVRPMCTFDLKNYEAKEAESDKSTHFELIINTPPQKKTYYFMALTRKDMLQWVAYINKYHETVALRTNGIQPTDLKDSGDEDDVSEHYDAIKPQIQVEDNEDEIYHELDDLVKPNSLNNNTTIPRKMPEAKNDHRPPLPGRRPLRMNIGIPIPPPVVKSWAPPPPPPPKTDSDESLASYDDIGSKEDISHDPQNISLPSLEDSFSDGDEDSTYEAFVSIKGKLELFPKSPQVIEPGGTNKNNYDNSNPPEAPEVPVLPLKPKVEDKPIVAKKPLKIEIFSRLSNKSLPQSKQDKITSQK